MTKALARIFLTETTYAVAITFITLMFFADSLTMTRLMVASLIGIRALIGTLNIVAKNAKLIAHKDRRNAPVSLARA